jgi:prophage regulatory protein
VSKKKTAVRLISKPEVLDRVGVTFPTLWKWMREGTFPAAKKLGGSNKPAWLESDVERWIAALPTQKYKPADNNDAA